MASLIDTKHLCDMIDGCIEELKSGESEKLRDLASLLRSLAAATKNDLFTSIYPSIGSFGSSLSDYRKLILLAPMITSDEKSRYRTAYEEIIKKGASALEILKEQVKLGDSPDYKAIVQATARFTECWLELSDKTRPFRQSRAASR